MAQSEGAEPTEEPTPQRLLKARERGQVAMSRDFSAALGFAALVAVLAGSAPLGLARLLALFQHALASAVSSGAVESNRNTVPVAVAARDVFVSILAVPLGVTMAVAVLVGAMQTGGLFSWKAARPDVTRLSPVAGFKRVFGARMLGEMAKGLSKVAVVLAVAVSSVGWGTRELPHLAGAPSWSVLAVLGLFARRLGVRVALVLVALGTIDWLLARRRHRRSLMMTRDEVKREYKESEGDPAHRSERQRLHREINEQRMIDDVRKADFVVVNPEHIAVAVKYDRDAEAAPQVVAKGERLMAERIKQVAREAGVPIYRDVGLARALNELPEGEEIPEALYEAVAELLRVLWEMDQGKPPLPPSTAAGVSVPSPAAAADGARPPARSSSTWKRV
jgi:flagellar biosynthesis protein FlhB